MPFGWKLDLPSRDTGEFVTTATRIRVTDRGSFLNEYRHEITIETPDGLKYIELGMQEMRALALKLHQAYLLTPTKDKDISWMPDWAKVAVVPRCCVVKEGEEPCYNCPVET